MYSIDSVRLDYEPRRSVSERLVELEFLIKMRPQDSAFICGLMEERRPGKVVEVGVANGGTSAVIMQCAHDLGLRCELHCVDRRSGDAEYPGSGHEIGSLGKEAAELLPFDGYRSWFDTVLPQVIERIGDGIDFLILDTTHKLPGEALDFLVAFPFLAEDAVVCVHDIRQNQKTPPDPIRIGTNALFNGVAADKFVCTDPSRQPNYPNIGAFRINPDTGKYITNVLGILTQNWPRPLPQEELDAYTKIIHDHYPEEACWLFDRAVEMNLLSLSVLT